MRLAVVSAAAAGLTSCLPAAFLSVGGCVSNASTGIALPAFSHSSPKCRGCGDEIDLVGPLRRDEHALERLARRCRGRVRGSGVGAGTPTPACTTSTIAPAPDRIDLGGGEALLRHTGHTDQVADREPTGVAAPCEERRRCRRTLRGGVGCRASGCRSRCTRRVRWSAVTTPSTVTVWPASGEAAPVPCTCAIVWVTSAAYAGGAARSPATRAPAAATAAADRR